MVSLAILKTDHSLVDQIFLRLQGQVDQCGTDLYRPGLVSFESDRQLSS